MKKKAFLLLLTSIILLLAFSNVWANGARATNLVAPYAHFVGAAPPATGPFTTHYLINNVAGATNTVNVKCYSDINNQRVGPSSRNNF